MLYKFYNIIFAIVTLTKQASIVSICFSILYVEKKFRFLQWTEKWTGF